MSAHKTLPALDLQALDFHDLWALHAALRTVANVVEGLLCQPKFFAGDDMNKAGEALEIVCDQIYQEVDNIEAVAKSRLAADDQEQLLKFSIIASRSVDSFAALTRQVATIATLAEEAAR